MLGYGGYAGMFALLVAGAYFCNNKWARIACIIISFGWFLMVLYSWISQGGAIPGVIFAGLSLILVLYISEVHRTIGKW